MPHRGYTLIELLLVITIISIMTSFAISTYRYHQQQHHIEKIALEMQNVAEASLNFQIDQGHWPKAYQDFPTCAVNAPPREDSAYAEFLAYLPNESVQSSLGNYYCWSSAGAKESLFFVALQMPKNNVTFAKRIAALLPNAIATATPEKQEPNSCTTDSDCYVRLEVTGSSTPASHPFLAGYGQCIPQKTELGSDHAVQCQYIGLIGNKEPKTVKYMVTFMCPENSNGDLQSSVNFLDVGTASGDPYVLKTLELNSQCIAKGEKQMECTLLIDAARAMGWSVASGAQGHIGASYTAYCSPKPKEFYAY
ncbi:MAG: hypothetical protein A3F17_03370 [Gammaproteobacteria bacterium RIFCSPHIGHO2_12_FULL_41_15]|nr:MAG: hypothetical protein A3F17_03370 [Gammaproteobacteria bacterium RIFCSPHIGHO2_12_FULL_41_15]